MEGDGAALAQRSNSMALREPPWRKVYSAFQRRSVCCQRSTNLRTACSRRRSDLRRSDVRTEYPRIPLPHLRVAYVDLARQTVAQTSTRIFRSIGAYSSIVADDPIALDLA